MSIYVIGLNHKTAPLHLREQYYFAADKVSVYLQDLLGQGIASEAVLLSTCNRSELYCETNNIEVVTRWFAAQAAVPSVELTSTLYIHQDEAAVSHIMEVACGLDSMMVGETQILGQLKDAFSESIAAGAVDALFHRLFQAVFMLAKDIRSTTAIGACPVSIASAAVNFAKQQANNLFGANILLIGAGDTNLLLMRYLKALQPTSISIANRDTEKAVALLGDANGQVYALHELETALAQADVVFSATGSALPIVSKTSMQSALQNRTEKPLIAIDIAVPRDIDPAVAELTNVHLFCIDDLKIMIEKNKQGREHAGNKAREVIKTRSRAFYAEVSNIDKIAHTIRAYRNQIEELCYVELEKAKQHLLQGHAPHDVLETFAQAYTKKLLHAPSVQLRQAGVEGRFELLQFAKQLFDIPDSEVKPT
jgi:glutamyl-tRNA reductase